MKYILIFILFLPQLLFTQQMEVIVSLDAEKGLETAPYAFESSTKFIEAIVAMQEQGKLVFFKDLKMKERYLRSELMTAIFKHSRDSAGYKIRPEKRSFGAVVSQDLGKNFLNYRIGFHEIWEIDESPPIFEQLSGFVEIFSSTGNGSSSMLYFNSTFGEVPWEKLELSRTIWGIYEEKATEILKERNHNFSILAYRKKGKKNWELNNDWALKYRANGQTNKLISQWNLKKYFKERGSSSKKYSLLTKPDYHISVPFDLNYETHLPGVWPKNPAIMKINRRLMEEVAKPLAIAAIKNQVSCWDPANPKKLINGLTRHLEINHIPDSLGSRIRLDPEVSNYGYQFAIRGVLRKQGGRLDFVPTFIELQWTNGSFKEKPIPFVCIQVRDLTNQFDEKSLKIFFGTGDYYYYPTQICDHKMEDLTEGFYLDYFLRRGEWDRIPDRLKLQQLKAENKLGEQVEVMYLAK